MWAMLNEGWIGFREEFARDRDCWNAGEKRLSEKTFVAVSFCFSILNIIVKGQEKNNRQRQRMSVVQFEN